MRYHGRNDGDHMQQFYDMLEEVCLTQESVELIVKTAKVVARLYRLQLEEIEYEIR
jgi:3-oxoacyl-[acyl-carrier-protein] synthase-3